jgi:hypothetical protein
MPFTLFQSQEQVQTDFAPKVAVSNAAVMVSGTTIFTISGGPIHITELISECITANDTTASTLRWSADGTLGSATTFTGATATLASAAPGTFVICDFTALTTAPAIVVPGVGLASVKTNGIIVPAGIITTTIAVGSTTGTWRHYMRYNPMKPGVRVRWS